MEDSSIQHCRRLFGHYGRFAILRLYTAVIHHDRYCLSGFKYVFSRSGKNHEDNPGLREFMQNLDYADAEYFNTDELRFLLQIATSYKKLTDEEIEVERQQIKNDVESGRILREHSEYLLKAVEYWKMHFREKFKKWRQEFSDADRGWIERKLACRDVTDEDTAVSVTDDGNCGSCGSVHDK